MNYLARFVLVTGLSCILIWLAAAFYSVPASDAAKYVEGYGYSTAKVREHLQTIAKEPHPTGSKQIKIVRDYLVGELEVLGANVEVQQAHAQKQLFGNQFFAQVENVIGYFNGSDNLGKPLLLMGHYDSFSHSPGANDNGHAVATILETMRVMQGKGGFKNDVIVLFTDAEEQGTLGITAFMEQHQLAKDIGLIINFEARGSKGPLRMFETSGNNNGLVSAFADVSPFPVADSFFYSLYQIMGNYTDMSVSLAHGVPGINLAYSDGFYHYHTMADSLENVAEASLLHAGSYALALTEHFGNIELPVLSSEDNIYFNASPDWFVNYSQWVGMLVLLVCLVLFITLIRSYRKQGWVRIPRVIWSMLAVVFQLLLVLMLNNGLNAVLGGGLNAYFAGSEGFFQLLSEDRSVLLGLALVTLAFHFVFVRLLANGVSFPTLAIFIGAALAVAVFENALLPSVVMLVIAILAIVLYLKVFGKSKQLPYGVYDLFAGYLGIWLSLVVLTSLLAPLMAHIFAWPLLISLVCLNLTRLPALRENSTARNSLIFAGALLAIYWWGNYAFLMFSSIGHMVPGVPMLFITLVGGLLVPLINDGMDKLKGLPAVVYGLGGLAVLLITIGTHEFDQEHQKPNELFYLVDNIERTSQWTSLDVALDSWTQQVFDQPPESSNANRIYPIVDKTMFVQDALDVQVTPIEVTRQWQRVENGNKVVGFTLLPGEQLEKLNIFIKFPERLLGATVNDTAIENYNLPSAQVASLTDTWLHWQFFGLPATGARFEFTLPEDESLEIQLTEVRYGLPAEIQSQLPERPENMMARSYSLASDSFSDTTVVISEFKFQTELKTPSQGLELGISE